ncbi:MAG TPA: hypothetical protein PLT25_02205 [Acidocella sp.]|nr:hypothetical protein [Acidocella sp.]
MSTENTDDKTLEHCKEKFSGNGFFASPIVENTAQQIVDDAYAAGASDNAFLTHGVLLITCLDSFMKMGADHGRDDAPEFSIAHGLHGYLYELINSNSTSSQFETLMNEAKGVVLNALALLETAMPAVRSAGICDAPCDVEAQP